VCSGGVDEFDVGASGCDVSLGSFYVDVNNVGVSEYGCG
jgi:hypothetical protein